jgi:hypothetical protein
MKISTLLPTSLNFNKVEVFKTNVSSLEVALWVKNHLLAEFPHLDVHFDLADCDQILRIEGLGEIHGEVICVLMHQLGYHCEVLDG